MQLGQAGRRASTQRMWEGMDEPLPDGNWPIISASPLPYFPYSQVPKEMTRADMDEVKEHFVRAAQMSRSEEHTSELQSQSNLVCRLLLEKKKTNKDYDH